ncbi:hypothetical protein ScPMuIL_007108 [Solemya velum]
MDPLPERRAVMANDVLTSVSVVDVYDQAAGIGKEFEKLIEAYGVECIHELMPKVIKALEHLEALATKFEQESAEIAELKFVVDKLESEKVEKAQERARYEEDLEQIEQGWRCDNKELWETVGKLQVENHRLKQSFREEKEAAVEEVIHVNRKTEEEEIRVLTKLKETVDRQRDDLRKFKRDLKQKTVRTVKRYAMQQKVTICIHLHILQTQLERVIKVNSDLRRKNTTQRKHARSLLEERVDLETQLAEKENQILQIRENLKEQEKSWEEKEDSEPSTPERLQGENIDVVSHPLAEGAETEEDEEAYLHKLAHKLSLVGKMVIDLKDPNRPRFTLHELRTVLLERNEMKVKLMEVEDELAALKPPEEHIDKYTGEETTVQGPINREPDDKLYPQRKKKGIRRFFDFVFGS